jgi:hypothetical protein
MASTQQSGEYRTEQPESFEPDIDFKRPTQVKLKQVFAFSDLTRPTRCIQGYPFSAPLAWH